MSEERISINLEPSANIWQDKQLIKDIATHNFGSLLDNLSKFKFSYLGIGYYGVVFRMQDQQNNLDVTLKIMRFQTPIDSEDLSSLFKASGIPFTKKIVHYFLLKDYRSRIETLTRNLTLMQVAGHVLGNRTAPNYIDAPVSLWIKDNEINPYEAIGYSLPYLNGKPIRICEDSELTNVANHLEGNYNLFLGSRGETIIRGSKNAIVLSNGNKRFIDVRVKDLDKPLLSPAL